MVVGSERASRGDMSDHAGGYGGGEFLGAETVNAQSPCKRDAGGSSGRSFLNLRKHSRAAFRHDELSGGKGLVQYICLVQMMTKHQLYSTIHSTCWPLRSVGLGGVLLAIIIISPKP